MHGYRFGSLEQPFILVVSIREPEPLNVARAREPNPVSLGRTQGLRFGASPLVCREHRGG